MLQKAANWKLVAVTFLKFTAVLLVTELRIRPHKVGCAPFNTYLLSSGSQTKCWISQTLVVLIHKQTADMWVHCRFWGFQSVIWEVILCCQITQKLWRVTQGHNDIQTPQIWGQGWVVALRSKTNTALRTIKERATSISWLIDPHWETCFGFQAADKSH